MFGEPALPLTLTSGLDAAFVSPPSQNFGLASLFLPIVLGADDAWSIAGGSVSGEPGEDHDVSVLFLLANLLAYFALAAALGWLSGRFLGRAGSVAFAVALAGGVVALMASDSLADGDLLSVDSIKAVLGLLLVAISLAAGAQGEAQRRRRPGSP